MSFNQQSWGRISGSANNSVVTLQNGTYIGAPNVFTYISATDLIATIEAANYFNAVAPELNVGDLIYAVGSDATAFLTVATVTVLPPTVTVSTGVVTGDVLGPASSTDNDIVVFNGVTGKIIKDGGVTIGYIQNGQLIYAADAGATDAYAITLSPALTAYTTGLAVNFKANTANTGASTLNINGLGAKTIKKAHDQDTATGDIEAGQIVSVVYDGTNFQMQSQSALPIVSGALNTVLQGQGLGSAPAFSTATYPATTTINQILYSSAANTVSGITTAVGGVLVSNATSVPSMLANPAATGKFLQSVINDAPIWSSAGFPTTVGALGTILRSDGTNWVATTATYPATTTINRILYSSAANTIGEITAANNGVMVSSNTGVPSMLAGPGTTGQVLQANAAAAPSFSTASYPSTTTINQILYSSASNTVAGLATANYGSLRTDSTGVPSITQSFGNIRTLTQTTHGFAVGDCVYLNSTTYTKAIASAAATAEVVGIVAAVIDANTFVLQFGGVVTGLSGLTAGTTYYLSPTSAGTLTATKPTATGQIAKALLVADTTTSGYWINLLGIQI